MNAKSMSVIPNNEGGYQDGSDEEKGREGESGAHVGGGGGGGTRYNM